MLVDVSVVVCLVDESLVATEVVVDDSVDVFGEDVVTAATNKNEMIINRF